MFSGLPSVFASLLGDAFNRLDAPLRRLHGGAAGVYQGQATVERGESWLAALACGLARLPRSVQQAPLQFELQIGTQCETWIRRFSGSAPMRSRLCAESGLLVERLGPTVVRYTVREHAGAVRWEAVQCHLLGVPLPRAAFDFVAHVHGRDGLYHFQISASLWGIGTLVRYQGTLQP